MINLDTPNYLVGLRTRQAMSLQIRVQGNRRGVARRAPNPTRQFNKIYGTIKLSFLTPNSIGI
jgi:hypothetical protein